MVSQRGYKGGERMLGDDKRPTREGCGGDRQDAVERVKRGVDGG